VSTTCSQSGAKSRAKPGNGNANRRGTVRALDARMAQSLLLDQAAELLGVSRRTVYYRTRDGRLRTIRARCGSQRVLVESIEEALRQKAERLNARRAQAGAARRRMGKGDSGNEGAPELCNQAVAMELGAASAPPEAGHFDTAPRGVRSKSSEACDPKAGGARSSHSET